MPAKKPPPAPPVETPAPRPRGRPVGTGKGKTTRRYGISLPNDLADWLDEQEGGPSAVITEALTALRARQSRRK